MLLPDFVTVIQFTLSVTFQFETFVLTEAFALPEIALKFKLVGFTVK